MRDTVDRIGIFPIKPHADRFCGSDGCRVRGFTIGIKRRIVCILQRSLQDGACRLFGIASALLIPAELLTLGSFALCGERPEALPLDSANF